MTIAASPLRPSTPMVPFTPMVVVATDFGLSGPYVGQMKAVLAGMAPGIPVIDLFADLPPFRPDLAGYVLAAHFAWFGPGAVCLAVVDPGVGTDRGAVALRWRTHADQGKGWQAAVGPDNGLLCPLLRRARATGADGVEAWRLPVPGTASASFHGRDIFAPAAAILAKGESPDGAEVIDPALLDRPDWPDDLWKILYIDHYGNAMTGIRAEKLAAEDGLSVNGQILWRARTFADVPAGRPMWYVNANDLVEIAVNKGRADIHLDLVPGASICLEKRKKG